MPALDPFSAAARPMRAFDAVPKNPLPFAATLQPIDPNTHSTGDYLTGSSAELPKPKKYKDGFPSVFPKSPFSHSRHTSFDFREMGSAVTHVQPKSHAVGSDEWMQERVAICVDSANGVLDLKGCGLTDLSTKIADLRDLVTLPPSFSPHASASSYRPRPSPGAPGSSIIDLPHLSPGSGHLSANSRSFSRVASAPASSAFFNTLNAPRAALGRTPSGLGSRVVSDQTDASSVDDASTDAGTELLASPPMVPPVSLPLGQKRILSRSKTGAVNLGGRQSFGRNTSLEIMLGPNSLRSLPSALFEISNITVLSLRSNQLTELPAAIGELRNLTDLNIGNNRIKELPSTILNISLAQFKAHPNSFFPQPPSSLQTAKHDHASAVQAASGRVLGPIQRSDDATVSRLTDICLNILISPRAPNNLPPLLDSFDWGPPAKGEKHLLHDPERLQECGGFHQYTISESRRVLQALKSAGHAYSREPTDSGRRGSNASVNSLAPPRTQGHFRFDPFPKSHRPLPPDDSAENPYFYPCPSPKHLEFDVENEGTRPSRHLFIRSAEERLEWREVHGITGLPIRWKGCSPGCLAFLEQEEEDEWGLDGDSEDGL